MPPGGNRQIGLDTRNVHAVEIVIEERFRGHIRIMREDEPGDGGERPGAPALCLLAQIGHSGLGDPPAEPLVLRGAGDDNLD
ncbi:MAG: hypothetical protein ACUVWX_14615 [Kiritimatiellia bacterium]